MISRRDLIKDSLAVVSLGLAVPSVFGKAVVAAASENNDASVAGKTLIVVQLAGGVDGLNVVVPYRDRLYRQLRPTLALKDDEMIPVDDRIAFHGSLEGLKQIYDQGQLAVIEGVGYPNPDFSHFRAMDIWQSADTDGVATEGWLGKYFAGLADEQGHPLAGLSIGRSLPAALRTQRARVPSVESLETFGLRQAAGDADPDVRKSSLLKLYDVYKPANARFGALLDTTLANANASVQRLNDAHEGYEPASAYPDTSLASGLRLLAELVHSQGTGTSPLRVGHVVIGGFDTHTQQPDNLARLLRETSEGISAFWQDITSHGHADDVLVMTWSEFGRRVPENAQLGTDHGAAGPMFLVGSALNGGFYGEPSNLAKLDNGNIGYSTDFRSVYATVLERWLEAPSDDILGGRFDQLRLFNT